MPFTLGVELRVDEMLARRSTSPLFEVIARRGGFAPRWVMTHPAVAWRGAFRAAVHGGAAPSAADSARAWAKSRPRASGVQKGGELVARMIATQDFVRSDEFGQVEERQKDRHRG